MHATGAARQYCKLCDRRDFDDPRVLAQLREIAGPGLRERDEMRRRIVATDSRPHIVLQARSAPWTSVFLALRKPPR